MFRIHEDYHRHGQTKFLTFVPDFWSNSQNSLTQKDEHLQDWQLYYKNEDVFEWFYQFLRMCGNVACEYTKHELHKKTFISKKGNISKKKYKKKLAM